MKKIVFSKTGAGKDKKSSEYGAPPKDKDCFLRITIIKCIRIDWKRTMERDSDGPLHGTLRREERLQKYEASPEDYYDAILMDVCMPEMDGLEATRRIRALARPDAAQVSIIALTANAFDEDVQRSLQAGLNAHLTKPVEPEALFSTLENLIRD